MLCVSGVFRKKGTLGAVIGIVIACVLRFACHFVSGCVFFRTFEIFNNPYLYSIAYNGTFMLPELVLTVFGAVVLLKIPVIKKLFNI